MIPAYNLGVIATRALVSLLVCLTCLWVGYSKGRAAKQGEWDASIVASREAQDKALQAAAEAVARIEVKHQTIVQKVRHEVSKEPVYRDCVVPDDGIRLLNDAIRGGSTEPAGFVGVQAASKPD